MKTGCAYALAIALAFAAARADAQMRYASGQDVAPVYEGWEHNADGSFNMVFGYMNRNYEEQVEVPVGPNNSIEPGPPDQGQPTHFYPRRQEFVFKVKVPQDWGDKDLVWTLTSHGKTGKAYGTITPVWEIGNMVYKENRGGPGALTYPEEPNEAPSTEMVGSSQRTVHVGDPLTLSVEVADDGHPLPLPRRGGGPAPNRNRETTPGIPRPESPISQAIVKLDPGVRLGVTWVVYRGGPGSVTFDPMKVPVVGADKPDPGPISGRATTKVTFSQPGTYVLRAYADDGILTTPLDVTVTVQP